MELTEKDKNRFLEKFKIGNRNECWEWEASKFPHGYGQFGLVPIVRCHKTVYAHRISYQIFKGNIPKGLHVLHICDNKSCVNPNHLYAGTHSDNMIDREVSGLANHACGERVGSAKLTKMEVLEIREALAGGLRIQRKLAKKYNISRAQICRIKNNKEWKI